MAQVWLALGIVTQLSGNPAGRHRRHTRRAVKIQPSDIGYLLLARALQQTGHNDEAQAAIAEAQRQFARFPRSREKCGCALRAAG